MLSARVADPRGNLVGDSLRTVMRRATWIAQRLSPAFVKPLEPFVAGLAADVVPRAELRHRVQTQVPVPNESLPLFHGYRLQPGHRPTSVGPQRSECHPCSRFVVLPMYPVCTLLG